MGFREALVEEQEKEKQQVQGWQQIAKRVFANFLVLLTLIGTAYAVVFVVERSTRSDAGEVKIFRGERVSSVHMTSAQIRRQEWRKVAQ